MKWPLDSLKRDDGMDGDGAGGCRLHAGLRLGPTDLKDKVSRVQHSSLCNNSESFLLRCMEKESWPGSESGLEVHRTTSTDIVCPPNSGKRGDKLKS